MNCPNCKADIGDSSNFCPECGLKLPAYCHECGRQVEENEIFCMECGAMLKTPDISGDASVPLKISAEEDSGETDMEFKQYRDILMGKSKMIEGTDTASGLNKKIQRRVAFKAMLLIAFITFFFPLCTVSCSGEKIISPNGYQAASNFGLSEGQLETLELTVEDVADPMIGIVIVLMVCGLFITGTVANSVQAIVAFFIMIAFKQSERILGFSDAGMQVEFKLGYYLALMAFLLAGTAFFWAPVMMGKKSQSISQFNALNSLLTACLVIVAVVAVVTNTGMIKGIPAAVYHRKDIGSFQNVESILEDGASDWGGGSNDSSVIVEDEKPMETIQAESVTEKTTYPNWVGTYLSDDGQCIVVDSCNENTVSMTFYGYSEEGDYTWTNSMLYSNNAKSQVKMYGDTIDTVRQEITYTLTNTGIIVRVTPAGGWQEGVYTRQGG